MQIIFFGTPHFVIPVLETLQKHFTIVAVVTAPDKKAGRKQLLTPSPIKAYAQSKQIKVLTPDNLSSLISQFSSQKPDIFVVAAYGYILPNELLEIPTFGAINLHPSLLPKFRGPTPVPSALLNGDTATGTTIIKMDEEMDHGPILAKQTYQINDADTTASLLDKLFKIGAEMLPEVITNYTSGDLQPESQDHSKATYTKKITKLDGFIDLNNPPGKTHLARMIKAYYPWPAVWSTVKIKGHELRIKLLPNGKVQLEGKNPVLLKELFNGYPELKPLFQKINL